ncbi:patatin-like phospholipase family protein [Marinoscillum sp. MHG1-6]|uniref:patatin-like phospholipase family protein n=1 Tax=Marinoscillum sp. MHG1-6 TaxID=2959627 RepID=UPI002157A2AB|nr:patatin-like phospholipase family protein [Marinoscillum sp. MHG1-6]
MPKRIEKVLYSFPVQLLFVHIKQNPSLVLIWVLLVALFSGGIGKIYGVHFLFLDPEYLNKVNFLSFFIVGVCLGCFIMAFHITCYILNSHQFPFIGILERPFLKFALNNSVIPFLVLIVYLVQIVRFQVSNEFTTGIVLFQNLLGLLAGGAIIIGLFFFYFSFTNKDIFKYLTGSVDKRLMRAGISRKRVLDKYKESRKAERKVSSYFDTKFRVRSTAGLNDFFDKETLLKVFDQNHLNSVIFEIGIICIVILLGNYMEERIFQIPAAGSSLLMMSFLFMLIGAISYWLKEWGLIFTIGLFILANVLIKTEVIKGIYEIRGLDYQGEKAAYNLENLRSLVNSKTLSQDYDMGIRMLDAWKSKQKSERPKALILCVSGGGQRAALWTVNALQRADEALDDNLMNRTILVSGASGGMIGAAYYRDAKAAGVPKEKQLKNMGKDNLNSVIYGLMVNDAIFRLRKFEFEDKVHKKDRGYLFEESLDKNLGHVFKEKLSDYKHDELNANIPVLLLSPVIANDGRKIYVSNLPVSYMNVSRMIEDEGNRDHKIWSVDFNRLFKKQDAGDVSFISALRMSASFPYITPAISLPSEPLVEVMDAGIADNFGVSDATRFLTVFRDWFETNTSGVVVLVIRDTRKSAPVEAQSNPSLIDRVTYPIASVYNNLGNIQDINNDKQIEELRASLKVSLETVELEYNTYTNIEQEYLIASKEVDRKRLERASLSWHLTTREKQNIIQNIELPNNQRALKKLADVMEE